jgi:tRNA pseudouridine38-40 synthase
MGARRNIRLILEYEGGGYHGWQIQPEALTIQEVLEDRIRSITQHPSRAVAAGRTDAGVHALQQVVHFHTPSALPVQAIRQGLNALLPPDVRVLRADEVDWSFHARFSAVSKRYEYRIWTAPVLSVFAHRYTWGISRGLDVDAMVIASRSILGSHDFTSFHSAKSDRRSPVRDVTGCGWQREVPVLRFWIEANGFLRYMVRSIVGTLVEIGLGKRTPDSMGQILAARDRRAAGFTAPARGLFLVSVSYPAPWNIDMREIPGWSDTLPRSGEGSDTVPHGKGRAAHAG